MARALYLNLPYQGHVNPGLALAEALVQRGDQVSFATSTRFQPAVEATGAALLPYTSLLEGFGLNSMFALTTYEFEVAIRQLHPLILNLRPDYLLVDGLCLWGRAVGLRFGLPTVVVHPTYAPPPLPAQAPPSMVTGFSTNVRSPDGRDIHASSSLDMLLTLRHTLQQLGGGYQQLDPWDLLTSSAAWTVVCTLPELQPLPDLERPRHSFTGPSLPGSRLAQRWSPADDRPLVYFSLGTLFHEDIGLFERCLSAFADARWQVVVGNPPEGLRASETAATMLQDAPQVAVLRHARLCICHGGMNTVLEALNFGIPLLVLPQMIEQRLIAQQVEALGLGLHLDRAALDGPRLRAAVDHVTADPSFRTRALALNAAERGREGVQAAANAILAATR